MYEKALPVEQRPHGKRRMNSRVAIAPLSLDDEADFLAAVQRSQKLHARWVTPPTSRRAFREKVRRMGGPVNYAFVIRLLNDESLVGYTEITNVVRGVFLSGYLGYYAFEGHERKGLMTEGVRKVARHAFKGLGLHRLEANMQPENRASVALARAAGLEQEGYSPRYLKIHGRWRDHERWAVVAC